MFYRNTTNKQLGNKETSITHIWSNLANRATRVPSRTIFSCQKHSSTYQPCNERRWCLKTLNSYLGVLETRKTQMGHKERAREIQEVMNNLTIGSGKLDFKLGASMLKDASNLSLA